VSDSGVCHRSEVVLVDTKKEKKAQKAQPDDVKLNKPHSGTLQAPPASVHKAQKFNRALGH
jgi:hypothetical protein